MANILILVADPSRAKVLEADYPRSALHEVKDFTIKYASVWLIGKAIQTTTEILFELRDDMKRNQKVPHGMFVLLGPNNTIQPASTPYWGQKENN